MDKESQEVADYFKKKGIHCLTIEAKQRRRKEITDKEQEEIMAHFEQRGAKCLTMKMKALALKKQEAEKKK